MPENIHKCGRMPEDERLLITGNEVWKLVYVTGKRGLLKKVDYTCCPYCGCLLKERIA